MTREQVRGIALAALMVLSVLSIAGGTASAAGTTTVSLTPSNQSVQSGQTATYDVVVDSASGGVGSFDVSVSTNSTANATITGATFQTGGFRSKSWGSNNESVNLQTAGADTSDSGSVTIATVEVTGQSAGSAAAIDVQITGMSDEAGQSYTISGTNNATLSVVSKPTEVSLNPSDQVVGPGQPDSLAVVVENASGGVGTFDVTISANSSTNATITDASFNAGQFKTKSWGANNKSVTLQAAGGNTADSGSVTVATVEVVTNETATIALAVDALGDEAGNSYYISGTNNATLRVVHDPNQGPIVIGNSPAKDSDGDSKYEDVDGDSDFDIVDIQALFVNRQSSAVQNNKALFNFNGDTDAQGNPKIDIIDVQALFVELQNTS